MSSRLLINRSIKSVGFGNSAARRFNSSVSSLKVQSQAAKQALLQGVSQNRSTTLSKKASLRYNSPEGLDQVFPFAYEIIQTRSKSLYLQASELEKQIAQETNANQVQALKQQREALLVEAEINNPEVQYNFQMNQINMEVPVYRHLAKQKWSKYEMIKMIQRFETLHVIPDTLPTINPEVEVNVQFPNFVNKWVENGEILSTKVTSRAPIFKIQEFNEIPQGQKYTILVIDPDTPDIKNNSFSTSLLWGLTDIEVSLNNPLVHFDSRQLIDYVPPVPEKNTPTHRYVVWVFRQNIDSPPIQSNSIEDGVQRNRFDIRAFVKQHNLQPVGGHVWRNAWDRFTEEVRQDYGLPAGRVFSKERNSVRL
ncbi:PEBP-like protein [Nadsonia fulvescens var. elongata DSM 6958]|uniref:Large ribosomal subunit protein mL38 n=1 Tax=Nadsonia fulvescens var. elongata DSM 6958 TaxID=857566 RepID=A0A1E3PG74_9ASCO|nr:PEBP-like protein [Nadsonia fulvescens var. elongata DSM 6958]